jgi:hypothetical protein
VFTILSDSIGPILLWFLYLSDCKSERLFIFFSLEEENEED